MLGRLRAELEQRLRWERVVLGKAHSEAVREIDGEQAYEKMRLTVEKASQPLNSSQFPSRGGQNAVARSETMVPAAGRGSIREDMPGRSLVRGLKRRELDRASTGHKHSRTACRRYI